MKHIRKVLGDKKTLQKVYINMFKQSFTEHELLFTYKKFSIFFFPNRHEYFSPRNSLCYIVVIAIWPQTLVATKQFNGSKSRREIKIGLTH